MYTFIFVYENGVQHKFERIMRAQYSQGGLSHNISENDLLTHCFPMNCTLHLFSDCANYAVNGNQIAYIEVKK